MTIPAALAGDAALAIPHAEDAQMALASAQGGDWP